MAWKRSSLPAEAKRRLGFESVILHKSSSWRIFYAVFRLYHFFKKSQQILRWRNRRCECKTAITSCRHFKIYTSIANDWNSIVAGIKWLSMNYNPDGKEWLQSLPSRFILFINRHVIIWPILYFHNKPKIALCVVYQAIRIWIRIKMQILA